MTAADPAAYRLERAGKKRAGWDTLVISGAADRILLATMLQVVSVRPDLPCTDDPELFFAESPDGAERAKALCGACPVRAACLAGALERREPWGVWGGELFLRGAIVPRKRPRGRPRKTDVAA